MPAPYSPDLRVRVLHTAAAGPATRAGRAAVAARFEVSLATVYLWLRQEREEGRRAAKPHAGGHASTFDAGVLTALLAAQNDRTLAELAAGYRARTRQAISPSSVRRLLVAARVTRKKKGAPGDRAGAAGRRRGA
jgi:transposase